MMSNSTKTFFELLDKYCPDCGRTTSSNNNARCRSCASVLGNKDRSRRPPKEILQELIWSIPTVKIAEKFGVSDNAVGKWCKFYGIKKPGRGYWAKVYAKKDTEK